MSLPEKNCVWLSDFMERSSSRGLKLRFCQSILLPNLHTHQDRIAWAERELGDELESIFLEMKDTKRASEWVSAIHKRYETSKSAPCFFFVSGDWDHKILEFIKSGVDEILPSAISETELSFRISLAKTRHSRLNRLQEELKDRINAHASIETAIQQREEFLGVCTHDLRSPIGLIQSSLSLLLNQYSKNLPEPVIELLSRSKKQAGFALTLVNDLLDISTYEQGLRPEYEVFDLDELLNEFHTDYRIEAKKKKIDFQLKNPVRGWKVLGDPDRIKQLLQNLFTNALKFTDSGKKIYLVASPFKGRRKGDPPYPMLLVSVKDEGRGMDELEIQKIFDKFTQLKSQNRSSGRGLGLSVAKQISNLHSGNIWVESKPGIGSTFHVLFPHVITDEMASQNRERPLCLVVEPDPSRHVLYEPISKTGCDFRFVSDGVEGIVEAFYYRPNIILINSGIPKISEMVMSQILKSDPRTSAIPVVLLVDKLPYHNPNLDKFLMDQIEEFPPQREIIEAILRKHAKAA